MLAIGNSIQAYATMSFTSRVYLGPSLPAPKEGKPKKDMGENSPATPLSSRTMGTWTMLQAIVRFYAAYHIENPAIYQMAIWTFVVAGFHFYSEWLCYKTARWSKGLAGPIIVASASLIWMASQYRFYVGY